MIYNINFGIGWASSGVEYAQKYRAQMFRNIGATARFVFLDFMSNENIQTLTSNMGFLDEEIIWLYQYFTDIKIHETTYTVDDLLKILHRQPISEETIGKTKKLYFEGEGNFITCYLKEQGTELLDRAEFVSNGYLIRKDYFSYTRIFSEYYAPYNNNAKVYMRVYYNENGSIAYKEYIDGDQSVFDFPDAKIYSKIQLVDYFMKKLNLSEQDIVILDRATNIGQAVLQNKGGSKIGVVVHAEHFSDNFTNSKYVLWNNFYDYQFTKNGLVDFYITATEAQNKLLKQQFKKYKNQNAQIYTIPVGSLDHLIQPVDERTPFSMITASRLAGEKHIDWIVNAVIKAKNTIPQLKLDIYGEGGEKEKLNQLINQYQANEYIQLKGHTDLKNIYSKYELFLSASTSEGFGLTLMEAVGSGLGLIGFDVNYGNPTFINHLNNGIILPKSLETHSAEEITSCYAEAIIEYFNRSQDEIAQQSYRIAEDYLTANVEKRWENLIKEVLND